MFQKSWVSSLRPCLGDKDLSDKTALVTGLLVLDFYILGVSFGGIGYEVALSLASKNCNLIISGVFYNDIESIKHSFVMKWKH